MWRCRPPRLRSSKSTRLRHGPDSARLVGVRRTATGKHVRHVAGKNQRSSLECDGLTTAAQVDEVIAVVAVTDALRLTVTHHLLLVSTTSGIVLQARRPVLTDTRRWNVPHWSLHTTTTNNNNNNKNIHRCILHNIEFTHF